MRKWTVFVAMALWASPVEGQTARSEPIEVPLRVEEGRLLVTVDGADGAKYDFVLGLGMTLLTESSRARLGDGLSSLTLGGIPVETAQSSTVTGGLSFVVPECSIRTRSSGRLRPPPRSSRTISNPISPRAASICAGSTVPSAPAPGGLTPNKKVGPVQLPHFK